MLKELQRQYGEAIFEFLTASECRHQDERKNVRYPMVRPVLIQTRDSKYPGLSREISRDGIGLMHRANLPLGRCSLVISLADASVSKIPIRIVWCKPLDEGWFTSGAQFLVDTEADFEC